jgi:hypothetical protein
MTTTLQNCTVSEKLHSGEVRIGRPTLHHISDGVYEVIARCRSNEGGQCFRSYGLFLLDDIPGWVWNAR